MRAHRCRTCKNPFQAKPKQEAVIPTRVAPIGKRVRRYETVDWHTLVAGDRIKVYTRSGPYYVGDDGARHFTTGGGVFRVLTLDTLGINVRSEGKKATGFQFLYMGPHRRSLTANWFRYKHRFKKVRT